MSKFKVFVYYFFETIKRFGHWLDLFLYFFLCNYFINSIHSNYSFLIYIIPIFQLIINIKYEYKVFKSKSICNYLLDNYRVQTFEGGQGLGKSSFAGYLSSFRCVKKVYTNEPFKINNKWSCVLTGDILNLDTRVDDGSLLFIDEASAYYNNLLSKRSTTSMYELDIFSQEILGQLIRHFFDGWAFYISVDCNRLPSVIRDNFSIRHQALGQRNKILSYFTGTLCCIFASFFGVKLKNGVRIWKIQDYVSVLDNNYTFDLSTQIADTNSKNFANLYEIVAFNNPYKFCYNDRFMRGLYEELPVHSDTFWSSFDFNFSLMSRIGYGEIVKFFGNKKNISSSVSNSIKTLSSSQDKKEN